MSAIRWIPSAPAALAVAVLAALVVATAPAASGRPAPARPLLTGDLARGQPVRDLDRLRSLTGDRTRSHGKVDGRLANLVRSGPQLFRPGAQGIAVSNGRVRVVIETRKPDAASRAIRAAGGRLERSSAGLLQAVVPQGELVSMSRSPSIDLVRAPYRRVEHAVSGESVSSTLAQAWHAAGLTGRGVKVAIVDGGFAGLAQRQAEGDLPANVVNADFCGGRHATASEHGTAVAEIVHEMAPDAQLHLVCMDTEVDLAAAVAYVRSQGIKIVNHSIGWFGPSRGDGTGYIGSLVADARANGILWVNSAGNEAETHWSGTFSGGGDDVHDWAPNGDEGNSFVWPDDSVICGQLKWDEWPAGISDFDLALVESGTNELIESSEWYQTGTQPPLEELCVEQSSGRDIVVFWAIVGYSVKSNPRLDLFSYSPPLQYQVAAGSIVDPATSPAALAVGALCWQNAQLQPYSSQGPTIDGRIKPDLVGHDSVSNATYGPFVGCPSGFAGTSASSPEVAGAAALVKQAYPSWGPAELQAFLVRNARDLGTPGPDNAFGAGELRMPNAPDLVAPTVTALASKGRRGKTVALVSRIRDDSGEFRLEAQVKRGGRVVATLRRGFVSASGATRVTLSWRAPATIGGTYRHCVRAIDRAGNRSAPSCAPISLR